jgi:hypothetical protein
MRDRDERVRDGAREDARWLGHYLLTGARRSQMTWISRILDLAVLARRSAWDVKIQDRA